MALMDDAVTIIQLGAIATVVGVDVTAALGALAARRAERLERKKKREDMEAAFLSALQKYEQMRRQNLFFDNDFDNEEKIRFSEFLQKKEEEFTPKKIKTLREKNFFKKKEK